MKAFSVAQLLETTLSRNHYLAVVLTSLGQAFHCSFYTVANSKMKILHFSNIDLYKLIHNKDFNYLKNITGKG